MRPEGKGALKDSHIVSVIIPTIGRPTLAFCREALEQQTRLPDEIIVIKDEERRGAAWARNEGIRRSRGDLLAFTDDDCVPPKDWLQRLIGAVDRFDAAGAGGLFTDADPLLQDIRHRRERRQGWIAEGDEQIDEVGLVGSGGNVLYRRVWLKTCEEQDGYVFNESFRISQDWELAWRLRHGGARLIFVPTRVAHCRYVNPLAFLQLQFTRGIGIAMLFKVQRAARTAITIHKSLLWEKHGALRKANWLRALWIKAVGPFDVGSFTSLKNYWLFWLGEKFQSAGFLWGLMRHRGLIARSPAAQRASVRPMSLPSFSIVLETENLANVPVEVLSSCLEALAQQSLLPQQANEVLLIETGDVPAEKLERLRTAYPWLLIHRAGPDDRYYEAKMEGFRHTTGQVVVFCDSDCRYGADWLRSIVEPFGADTDIHVVAGETAVAVTGPYSLAVALIWSFAPFSRRTAPYRSSHYAANNVAFRRDVLLRCPIPCHLPMYRGSGAIHERMLRRMGYQIWKQPAARAIHPLPTKGLSQFFWRWLLYGHDQLVSEQFSGDGTAGRARIACWGRGVVALLKILSLGSWKPLRRLLAALREDPRRVIFLPVAVCVILATTLIALAGFVVACIRPGRVVLLGVERLRDANVQAPGQENAGV